MPKQLFHIVTCEPEEEYSFYLTADIGVQDAEIIKRLLSHYGRNGYKRIYFTFEPGKNLGKKNKNFDFYIHITDLGNLDDRVLKNVMEHSPDELIDVEIFR